MRRSVNDQIPIHYIALNNADLLMAVSDALIQRNKFEK